MDLLYLRCSIISSLTTCTFYVWPHLDGLDRTTISVARHVLPRSAPNFWEPLVQIVDIDHDPAAGNTHRTIPTRVSPTAELAHMNISGSKLPRKAGLLAKAAAALFSPITTTLDY